MSKHSRKEFQLLCGVTRGYLATYIGRGKVVLDVDGLIDDQVYENNVFAIKLQEKNKNKPSTEEESSVKIELPLIEEVVNPKEEISVPEIINKPKPLNKPEIKPSFDMSSTADIDLQKKKVDLLRAKEELEIKIITKKKLMGEVIPVDLVIGVFTRHFKNVTDSQFNALDNLLTEISHRFKMNREDTGTYRKKIIDLSNEVTRESMEITLKEIESIVNDFSQTRGVGQRK